jgi:hypothetical protein
MKRTRTAAELAKDAARTKETQAFNKSMRTHLLAAMEGNTLSDRQIATLLNRQGLRTRSGERWTFSAVTSLRGRLGILKPPRGSSASRTGAV